MSQHRDDTTEPPERAPGRYYYDDTTGYEVYDPTQDEDDDDETGESDTPAPARA